MAALAPYQLTAPLPSAAWGAEVAGIRLAEPVSPATVAQIKADLHRHRLLVFRNQGVIEGQRQVEVSSWFGEMESTFYKHPRSPHPDVFRVSNDEAEGCTRVGRTGWHIDGSFMAEPFSVAVYHIVSVPSQGDTVFVPLRELYETAPPEQRERWSRAWMVSNRRTGPVHPLVYPHPVTGESTMCFHVGMTEAVAWEADRPKPQMASIRETRDILDELAEACGGERMASLRYAHKWQPGDFIISDNLAVAHEASPETQLDRSAVGLRVMHRCTVAGTVQPGALRRQKDAAAASAGVAAAAAP